MPPFKRWFPVSHDINADAEVWAMRHQIGEKSLSIWLEFLSIADRNDGCIPGDLQELVRSVSGKCQAAQRTVRAVYDFALSRLWLSCEPTLKVSNFSKYHRTRVPNKAPSEPSEPILTKPKPPISPKGVPAIDFRFEKLWSVYPKKVGKQSAYRAWVKEAKHSTDTEAAIYAALKWQVLSPAWIKDGAQFIPHLSTYLNQRRWLDEPEQVVQITERTKEDWLAIMKGEKLR